MRVLRFFTHLCTCFSELSSLVPCPTFEVSLNNKEKGKFASSLSVVKLDTISLW